MAKTSYLFIFLFGSAPSRRQGYGGQAKKVYSAHSEPVEESQD